MLRDRDVADALGELCDGREVSAQAFEIAKAALSGAVQTSNRGERLYYAQVDTMALDHVDTAEGIWSAPSDGLVCLPDGTVLVDLADDGAAFEKKLFVLTLLREPERLGCMEVRWVTDPDPERQSEWQLFVRRVIKPLSRFL